jgi:uncharacterized protein (DUF885 family)
VTGIGTRAVRRESALGPSGQRRRALIKCAIASAIAVGVPPQRSLAQSPPSPTSADRLDALLDRFARELLDASPEEVTSLGLDVSARAGAKGQLNDRSLEFQDREKARIKRELRELRGIDRTQLRGMDRVNYDVVLFCLQAADVANDRYSYGSIGGGIPYVVSQLTGAYTAVPEFLAGQHQIATVEDATAYLSRLEAFATALDQEDAVVRHDATTGCIAPAFVLDKAVAESGRLRAVPSGQSTLVESLAKRTREKGIADTYASEADAIVREKVYPAIDRQIATLQDLRAQATHEAGVWKLPRGESYYADSLNHFTGSALSPAEIHRIGVDAVAEHVGQIDKIMRRHGMTKGSVAERLGMMFRDPGFLYPNTEAGRTQLIADLNAKVALVKQKLPQYFGALPKADVVVRRVPAYMEGNQLSGYYEPASLDGTRPGCFYINLRNMAETPSWTLPTHAFHESIPGHHVKLSLYQETKLPLIRKTDFFSLYLEGWSTYAEELADEMGVYEEDPFGRIGYLHGTLRAAVAMVTDTGIHHMRWSRERAIEYFAKTLGDPMVSAGTEIDRYCIWPGQVCSYMLDKLAILKMREQARRALGTRFDIRRFHDAILLCGAAPPSVLESVVDEYVSTKT